MLDSISREPELVEYLIDVIQDLQTNYNLDHKQAMDYISKSTFWKMMKKHPDFVLHYNAEHWSKDIITERNSIYQMN